MGHCLLLLLLVLLVAFLSHISCSNCVNCDFLYMHIMHCDEIHPLYFFLHSVSSSTLQWLVPTPRQFRVFFRLYSRYHRCNIYLHQSSLFSIILSLALSIFLKQHNFILYLWQILHCIYHIFFIHSIINGNLGWFHWLAIVHSLAINGCASILIIFRLTSFWIHVQEWYRRIIQ